MKLLRRIVKIFLLCWWCLALMPAAAVSLLFARRQEKIRQGAKWAQIWARGAAKIAGVKVHAHGDVSSGCGALLVSNHLSYLDILAHGSIFPIRFTPKAEIRKWFLFGWLVALNVPVWIDRKAPLRSTGIVRSFQETLANRVSLLVYPEGTTTDGKHGLLPFKSTPFASLDEQDTIQPLVTFYRQIPVDAPSAAWFDDTGFLKHIWNVLGLKEITIDVFIMPAMRRMPGEGRKELASRIREAMLEEYCRHEQIS